MVLSGTSDFAHNNQALPSVTWENYERYQFLSLYTYLASNSDSQSGKAGKAITGNSINLVSSIFLTVIVNGPCNARNV